MTVAEARAEIEMLAQATEFPALTTAEVDSCLRASKRASESYQTGVTTTLIVENEYPAVRRAVVPPDQLVEWAEATPYKVGAQVTPTVRNGHVYKATVAGTSGATEPVWPTTSGATITDGGVTWQEAGVAQWVPTFQIAAGVVKAIRLKLAKLATAYDVQSDDQRLSRSQMTKQFQDLERLWGRRLTATVTLHGSLRRDPCHAILGGDGDDCECDRLDDCD